MFHNSNPKHAGRQTFSKIKNIQGDGTYINVLNSDGVAGDPVIVFNPGSIFGTGFIDYTRYALTNPTNDLLFSGSVPKLEYGLGFRYNYRFRGLLSGAAQTIDAYIDGNFLATITNSGVGPWHLDFDIFIVNQTESILSGKWLSPNGAGAFQYSDFDGTGFALDFSGGKSIELYASDGIGSGVDMTCDAVNVYYSPP